MRPRQTYWKYDSRFDGSFNHAFPTLKGQIPLCGESRTGEDISRYLYDFAGVSSRDNCDACVTKLEG